jgi:hypothetical protein
MEIRLKYVRWSFGYLFPFNKLASALAQAVARLAELVVGQMVEPNPHAARTLSAGAASRGA